MGEGPAGVKFDGCCPEEPHVFQQTSQQITTIEDIPEVSLPMSLLNSVPKLRFTSW